MRLQGERKNRPAIERMDQRILMAVTAMFDVATLTVVGDEAANNIVVTQDGESLPEVTVDGAPLAITGSLVGGLAEIEVALGGGDDSLLIRSMTPSVATGQAGNDTITGGWGNDTLFGGDGSDSLDGAGGDDQLHGDDVGLSDNANDTLHGSSDEDVLFSAGGSDLLDGGSQNPEAIDFNTGDEAIYQGRTDDLALSLDGVANDGASGETGNLLNIEDITAGDGDDTILGSSANNFLDAGKGTNSISGFGGDDLLTSRTVLGDTGVSTLDGGGGDDVLQGGEGDDLMLGQAGNDQLDSTNGNDTMRGGSGNDALGHTPPLLESFTAQLFGEGGNDTLTPTRGKHLLDGGSGDDQIFTSSEGEINSATVNGQAGNDLVIWSPAPPNESHIIFGGSGEDRIFRGSLGRHRISFDGVANDGEFTAPGFDDDNIAADFEIAEVQSTIFNSSEGNLIDASAVGHGMTLRGGDADDTLIGGSSADLLEGNDGADSLVGNAGEDVLRGAGGRDTLDGGAGPDSFNGGKGHDQLNAADGEADTVNGAAGLGDSADIDELLDTVIRVESTT